MLDDTWAVSSALQSAYHDLPLLLFAQSMGSFIGQTLIGEHGEAYAGVVLAGRTVRRAHWNTRCARWHVHSCWCSADGRRVDGSIAW